MEYVVIVIALALIEFTAFALLTGQARGKYNVAAPATTGHPIFERFFRVQQNTMEQLIVFIPAIMMFATYVSPQWAALIGSVFLVGRVVYLRGYVSDPKSRGLGFMLSFIPNVILLLGGLTGAVLRLS